MSLQCAIDRALLAMTLPPTHLHDGRAQIRVDWDFQVGQPEDELCKVEGAEVRRELGQLIPSLCRKGIPPYKNRCCCHYSGRRSWLRDNDGRGLR